MTATLEQPVTTSTAQSTPAVQIIDLCKSIDERPILRGVDLSIDPGDRSPSSARTARKEHAADILATLTSATAGEARLFGVSLRNAPASLAPKIGLISHQSLLYRDLTAREILEFFAKLYGIPDPATRAINLLSLVGLGDRADTR